MSVKIIDYPHFVDESCYHETLKSMAQRLVRLEAVKAVYQIGGISSPGISDLDMVVVFHDGVSVEQNVLAGLGKKERYLFIHNLYGISANNFAEAERFAFYHHYQLIGGEEVRSYSMPSEQEIGELKIQIALEFMVKMQITLFLQHKYGVLRMRDLLLHVKALQYDLDFLGVNSGVVQQHVSQVIEWRKNWFVQSPSYNEVKLWWEGFYPDYCQLLEEKITSIPFYLPPAKAYKISKNIFILPSIDRIEARQKGFMLPKIFSVIGKKYFRLQNRLNSFQFEIPVKSLQIPDMIEKKFHFEKSIVEYNKKYLPHFLPLTSSLHAI